MLENGSLSFMALFFAFFAGCSFMFLVFGYWFISFGEEVFMSGGGRFGWLLRYFRGFGFGGISGGEWDDTINNITINTPPSRKRDE